MPLPEEFTELARAVCNWGRWGPDDERGTLNLVTPEAVRRGAACVRHGHAQSLALPLHQHGPQTGFIPGRINPIRTMISLHRTMGPDPDGMRSNDDMVVMGLQAATHWDALAHVSYAGRMYNGHSPDSVGVGGAKRCGIDKVGALVSRGVLLDVARAKAVDRLEPGYAVTGEDLDAAEELSRVRVEPGDVVLVRTGHMSLLHRREAIAFAYPSPGLSMQTVRWLHRRGVAAVGTDTLTGEVFPCEREDVFLPVHLLHLVEMGLLQGQNFDLEALSQRCAEDAAYAFLIDASPEPFVRGLGAPVNPVVIT